MKRTIKSIISLILVAIIFSMHTLNISAINIENEIIINHDGFISLKDGKSVRSNLPNIGEAKLVTTQLKNITREETEELYEVVNNGTDVFIKCNISDEISRTFCKNKTTKKSGTNGCFVGWYIHNDGMGIKATPLYIICLYPEKSKISLNQYLNDCIDIAINYKFEPEKLYKTFNKTDTLNLAYKNSDKKTKAILQGMSYGNLDDIFFDDSEFYYAFGRGIIKKSVEWGTISTPSEDDYEQIGYGKIHLVGSKIGTRSGYNYDNMSVCATVGASSNYYVNGYTIKLASSGYHVFSPEAPDDTDDETVTVSFGTSLNSSGELTNETTVSTSYNPDGQDFSSEYDGDEIYLINSSPASNKKGVAWEMVSNATVVTSKDSIAIFMAVISSLQIKKLLVISYNMPDLEAGIAIAFKNHSEL